ncbi:MAG: trigger factor [Candidatus Atribacteria bacterium]|nr:trigger factor [Candidatus Atribacteria bacterium]
MVEFKKEEKEKHVFQYEITIGEEAVQQAVEKILQEVNRRTVVPGFRKGHAPRAILRAHVSKEYLNETLTKDLVPEAFKEVIGKEKLQVIGEPDLMLVQVEEGKPLIFQATVIEQPTVTLAHPEELEIRKYRVEVRELDVEKEIDGLRSSKGTWNEKENKIVEEGDLVKVKVEDEEFAVVANPSDEKSPVGRGVMGMQLNEKKSVMFPGTDGKDEEEYPVTVLGIMVKEVSRSDEEFLKKMGEEYQTMDDLRKKVQELLGSYAKDLADLRFEKEAVVALCRKSEVAIPSPIVNHEVTHQIDEFKEHLEKDGMTMERYMELTNSDFAAMETNFRKLSEWNLKKIFVFQEYAEENHISVTDEEIFQELDRMAERSGKGLEEVRSILKRNDKMDQMRENQKNRKLLNDLVAKVKVKEVPESINFDQWKALEDPEEEMVS